MRKFLGAAAMLALVASPVLAQTTPAKPMPATPPSVTAPSAATPSVPNTTTPGTVLRPSTADTPMKAVPGAPLAGANSFTESQAKARIEALKARGVDHLMLWFMDAPDTDGMAYFMDEIGPSFR